MSFEGLSHWKEIGEFQYSYGLFTKYDAELDINGNEDTTKNLTKNAPTNEDLPQDEVIDFEAKDVVILKGMRVMTPMGLGCVSNVEEGSNQYSVILDTEKEEEPQNEEPVSEGDKEKGKKKETMFATAEVKSSITIFVNIIENKDSECVELEVPINNKIIEILKIVGRIINKNENMLSLFYNGDKLDSKNELVKIEGLADNTPLLCMISLGELKKFVRFRSMTSQNWQYTRSDCWDAVTFNTKKPIMIEGFSSFGTQITNQDFKILYKIKVNGTIVVNDTTIDFKYDEINDKMVKINLAQHNIILQEGENISIIIRLIGDGIKSTYGESGDNPAGIEGNDDFITITECSDSNNCTNANRGQIPALHYYRL